MKLLRHTPKLLQEYDGIINEQVRNKIVEPVKLSESEIQGRIHYIPHHAVVHTCSYDASTRDKNGTSLNNCLHKGLKFDQNIINILIHVRVHRVALSADIEKAFLMVGID